MAQSSNVSLRQAAFALKRQDSAHRRYLQALGALAMVRRLMPAAVEPCGFRPPIEPLWDRAGEAGGQSESEDGDGGVEVDPGRPASLVVFEPADDGSGPGRKPGRSRKQTVPSAS